MFFFLAFARGIMTNYDVFPAAKTEKEEISRYEHRKNTKTKAAAFKKLVARLYSKKNLW